jgi:hypothetical protein
MSPENLNPGQEPTLEERHEARIHALDLAVDQLQRAETSGDAEQIRIADLNVTVMRAELRDFESKAGRPFTHGAEDQP